MTNGMNGGTAALMNFPTALRGPESSSSDSEYHHHHSDEEVVMVKAEEESFIMEEEKLERQMLTVALVNSVVEDQRHHRYGLRKRRRPSNNNNNNNRKRRLGQAVSEDEQQQQEGHPIIKQEEEEESPRSEEQNTTTEGIMSSSTLGIMIKQEDPPPDGALLSVPNPLAASSQPPPPPLAPPSSAHPAAAALPKTVPCPLPPFAEEKPEKKVTISEPQQQQRGRLFSLDLDPAGLELDMTISIPCNKSTTSEDLNSIGRERGFSFEFFSFNADEPLPTDEEMPQERREDVVVRRERGDSIIFDPTSFQEGGIHEANALSKARATSLDLSNVEDLSVASGEKIIPVEKPASSKKKNSSMKSEERRNSLTKDSGGSGSQMVTLPSALGGSPVTAATFQMELLNKDGRIGIYLPEARKARIARFHAKRKMRIWRKRIKYDCRKKLADSRPRIKGRFVKRAETEDE